MPRRLILFLGAAALAQSAIWPEQLWEHKRTSVAPLGVKDKAVWEEYGLDAAEEASYGGWKGIGYRMKDPTSALAVYQWLRPVDGKPSPLEKVAVQTATRAFILKGNYVLDFVGRVPTQQELDILHVQLARLDQSALPSLPSYLPTANLIPGSERYIVGPASLALFEPRIPPSTAAFSLSAEGQLAKYKTPAGEANLAMFYYPTPQIAREKLSDFQKLPGAVAKRAGPIVAVTLNAPNPDEAEKLLSKVNYQATITWSEKPPTPEPGAAELLLGIFVNIGIIFLAIIVAGLLYAGVRIGWRRMRGRTEEDEAMLTLNLGSNQPDRRL